MLQIEQLSKRFGTQTVLRGIDLTLAAGEFFALLGPSGCGKTTLLRLVGGIETAERGRLLLQGQDITRWSAAQRRFGTLSLPGRRRGEGRFNHRHGAQPSGS